MPPKRKRAQPSAKEALDSDSSDSGTAAEETPKCVDANTKADEPSAGTTNDATKQCAHRAAKPLDGNVTWKLDKDKDRVLTISEFKGKTYVNIRDYYEKGGKLLPGKGISLTVDQWRVLGECVADVDAVLAVNK